MVGPDFAHVIMWDKQVGTLTYNKDAELCVFQYDSNWLRSGIEISPINLPLSNRCYQFPTLPSPTFRGLPGPFADSLPDAFGNAVLGAWLACSDRDIASCTALERLLITGTRGMGALEYVPATEPQQNPVDLKGVDYVDLNRGEPINLTRLVETAQAVMDHRAGVCTSFTEADRNALTTLARVGTSAGGARPKAVIGINDNRTEILCGHTDLPAGFEHYLLKFDGVVDPLKSSETFGDPLGYGRMEYAYFLMAHAAGLDISPCELLIEGERAHFITKRFDRIGNRKLHYQSLCAMDHADYQQPGHYSYERLFSLMGELKMPDTEILELYRRMAFNIIARNHDDHTKNFGFILDEQNQWRLAPAFDVAFSYRPGSKWINSHQMTLNNKREHFTRADLLTPAENFSEEANHIIDEIIEVVSQWPQYAKEAGVFADYSGEIQAGHRLHLEKKHPRFTA